MEQGDVTWTQEGIMDRIQELRELRAGRYLTRGDLQRLVGRIPPQTEFSFRVEGKQKGFRRWKAEGREAWEVTE